MRLHSIDSERPGTAPRALAEDATAWLVRRQQASGRWEDYAIGGPPGQEASAVGASDQWVTAFVASALLDIAGALPELPAASAARGAAERAALWLRTAGRTYAAGWGYNGRTGADADSTAWACLLLRRLGHPVEARDEAFLLSCLRPGGGFATYPRGAEAWSEAHADVSVPAFLALSAEGRARAEAGGLWDFLLATSRPDGLWPAYWWRTPYYHTLNLLLLLRSTGREAPWAPPPSAVPGLPIHDAADVAYLAAIDALRQGPGPVTETLLGALRDRRHPEGGWPSSAALRIPRPHDTAPDVSETAAHVPDLHRFMSTAHTLRALAVLAAEHRES